MYTITDDRKKAWFLLRRLIRAQRNGGFTLARAANIQFLNQVTDAYACAETLEQ